MWRPSPRHSKKVIFRNITFDNDNTDEYGSPTKTYVDVEKVVEVYPYSDVVKREAIGITNEEVYTVIVDSIKLNAHDEVIMDDMVYKIKTISKYEPLQLVIVNAGKKDEVNG